MHLIQILTLAFFLGKAIQVSNYVLIQTFKSTQAQTFKNDNCFYLLDLIWFWYLSSHILILRQLPPMQKARYLSQCLFQNIFQFNTLLFTSLLFLRKKSTERIWRPTGHSKTALWNRILKERLDEFFSL